MSYESKVSMAIATVKHFARQSKKANLSVAEMVVLFDNWYFSVKLCKTIDQNRMIWITQNMSNRILFLPDEKGEPTIKNRDSDFTALPTGEMKPLYRKNVCYHNINLPYIS